MKQLFSSPLFTIVCATISFVLLIWGSQFDTTVPDMIATEALHNAWVETNGSDQTVYHNFMIACLTFALIAVSSFFSNKAV